MKPDERMIRDMAGTFLARPIRNLWGALEAVSDRPEAQAVIARAIEAGLVRVEPGRSGRVRIVPLGMTGPVARPRPHGRRARVSGRRAGR